MENENAQMVKAILLNHFNVAEEEFSWDKPLDEVNKDFALLGNLTNFEDLLQAESNKKITLVEHISTNFHSAKDVLKLIE
ncbi:MAG: hypothetical protein WCR52_19830 [Bacteroidota bacterium]